MRANRRSSLNVDLVLPDYAQDLYLPSRYKVLYGGRGSAKTWTQGRRVIERALQRKSLILCTRELQSTIADSIHSLLVSQIDLLGLHAYFTITQTEIRCVNGSRIIFKGLRHNTREIKSLEGVDIAFVEEAEKCSHHSWEILIPTIRKEASEFWINFNPDLETDPTYVRFVRNPPPGAIVKKVTHADNPFFPDVLKAERDYLRDTDHDAYLHVWEGEPRRHSDIQVFAGKWVIDAFEASPAWAGPYFGADWGFAQDPTVLVKFWIDLESRALYVQEEAFGYKTAMDDIPALFDTIKDCRKHCIRADNSRPEMVHHLAMRGFRIISADKWPGCVQDGIEYLRSFRKIVVHQRCRHIINEFRLYSYKTDRLTGEIKSDIVDAHNHGIDALRYACGPMIKSRVGGFTRQHLESIQKAEKTTIAPGLEEQVW